MKQNNKNPVNQTLLPHGLKDALLLAVSPELPPANRATALRARVLAQLGKSDAAQLQTVRAHDGLWQNIAPLVDMKLLHDDGLSRSILLRLQPGGRLPAHGHAADEECIVLEGEGSIGDIFLRAGDYHLAPKGMRHGETFTATGALLFIRTAAPAYQAGA